MTDQPKRSGKSLAPVALMFVGAGINAWSLSFHPRNVLVQMLGALVYLPAVTWTFFVDPDLVFGITIPILAVANALAIADDWTKDPHAVSRWLVGVVMLLLVLAPLPSLGHWFRKRQDEMQRSLLTAAGALAFVCLVVASFGYYVLTLITHIPAMPSVLFPAAGVVIFCIAWASLRFSVTR